MESKYKVQLLIIIPEYCSSAQNKSNTADYMESLKIRSIIKFLTNTDLPEIFSGSNTINVLADVVKSKDATVQFRNFFFKNQTTQVLESALLSSLHLINSSDDKANLESQILSIKSDEDTVILAYILNHGAHSSVGQAFDIEYSFIMKTLDRLPSKEIILFDDECHGGVLTNYFNLSKLVMEIGITDHVAEIHELFNLLLHRFKNCPQVIFEFIYNFDISRTKALNNPKILFYQKIFELADGTTFDEFLENMHYNELNRYGLINDDLLSIRREFPDIPLEFFEKAKDLGFINIRKIRKAVDYFFAIKVKTVEVAKEMLALVNYIRFMEKIKNILSPEQKVKYSPESLMESLQQAARIPGIFDLYQSLDAKNKLVEFTRYSRYAALLYNEYPIPKSSKVIAIASCDEDYSAANYSHIEFDGRDNLCYGCVGSSEFLAALVMERGTVGDAIRRTIEEMKNLEIAGSKKNTKLQQIPNFATMNEDLLQLKVSDFLGDRVNELIDKAIPDESIGPFRDDYERQFVQIILAAGWEVVKRVDEFAHAWTKSSAVASSQSEVELEIDFANIDFSDSDSDYSDDNSWDMTKNPRYFEYPVIIGPFSCSDILNRGRDAVLEFYRQLDALLEEAGGPEFIPLETTDSRIEIQEAIRKLNECEQCLDMRFRSYPFYCKTRKSLSYFLYKNLTDFNHDYYPLFEKAWENFVGWFDSQPYEYSDGYSD